MWRREPLLHGCVVAPSCVRTDSRVHGPFSIIVRLPARGHCRRCPHRAGSPATPLLLGAREERKTPRSAASSARGGRDVAQWISPLRGCAAHGPELKVPAAHLTKWSRGARDSLPPPAARVAPPTPCRPLRLRHVGHSACTTSLEIGG
jgi:hypothetical protein